MGNDDRHFITHSSHLVSYFLHFLLEDEAVPKAFIIQVSDVVFVNPQQGNLLPSGPKCLSVENQEKSRLPIFDISRKYLDSLCFNLNPFAGKEEAIFHLPPFGEELVLEFPGRTCLDEAGRLRRFSQIAQTTG